jgi:hypothetical protein
MFTGRLRFLSLCRTFALLFLPRIKNYALIVFFVYSRNQKRDSMISAFNKRFYSEPLSIDKSLSPFD